MRRALSILLVVLFGLPPLLAMLPGSEDAGLPACCRRNGAHHCSMPASMLARMMEMDHAPGFQAPSQCSQYPRGVRANLSPVFNLASDESTRAVEREASAAAARIEMAPDAPQAFIHEDRGPPSAQAITSLQAI